jgi:hypothetical protein
VWEAARAQLANIIATGTAQASANVTGGTLAPRVYPNPWRADKHAGVPLTFDQITAGGVVKVFTVSGHWVKTLTNNNGVATWDLTTDSGASAASGLYFYTVRTPDGQLARGKFALIR